jgi:hypothetical protein
MSTHDILRERLLARAGLSEPKPSRFNPSDLPRLEQSEWSPEFEGLMRNRLLMGALRYGTMVEKRQKQATKWDLLGALRSKLEGYERTGNTEYLVDGANYLLLAFELDDHPTKHFRALDDHSDHCKPKKAC